MENPFKVEDFGDFYWDILGIIIVQERGTPQITQKIQSNQPKFHDHHHLGVSMAMGNSWMVDFMEIPI